MTVDDVAAFLRIPASSVYKLAQEGKLPALKVGRHWRFMRSMINQWVIDQAARQQGKLPRENQGE